MDMYDPFFAWRLRGSGSNVAVEYVFVEYVLDEYFSVEMWFFLRWGS
jgi:hypothetical protein